MEIVSAAAPTPTSRWARSMHGDVAALRELAGSYWYCVYAWWRRRGHEDAATLTVACWMRWLTKAPPVSENPGSGRLREWLRARLADTSVEDATLIGEPALEIAADWATERYTGEPEGSADEVFGRRWALTVLEFAMDAVREEYAASGRGALFAEVSPFAGFEGGDDERYASMAARMDFTTGAARKAVFDFRTRHREFLRAFIGDTVADPADIDRELTALLCACDLPTAVSESTPLPTAIRSFQPDQLFARAMRSVKMTSGGAGLWTPPTDAEAARLFPQYEMLGLLGHGGMGAVYKARQVALDRFVAIKLLPLEVSVDQGFADRFVREARALAKLSHPHIIAVHDFGTTAEGHLYFVMEFVAGSDLASLIHGDGLTPEQALDFLDQVCTALAYAHGKGVVHRDIKPANVMIDLDGAVKVADFGLARLNDPTVDSAGYTVAGMVMGTPDYMAPEQSRGAEVDQRADLYSAGVMLYEMLCREVPKGVFDPPSSRIGCDPLIDGIVTRAMQQIPDRRYASALEMRDAIVAVRTNSALGTVPKIPEKPTTGSASRSELPTKIESAAERPFTETDSSSNSVATPRRSRKLVWSLAPFVVAICAVGAFSPRLFSTRRSASENAPVSIPAAPEISAQSIAVLPLENLSPDHDDAFFADGLQDDLLCSLARIKALKVISRSSVMSYRDVAKRDLKSIGQQLGVANVLEGSVRRAGDRVLLTVHLTTTRDGREMWGQRYDRTLENSLTLQGELASEIASALSATLSVTEKNLVETKPTDNPQAYLLYFRAREFETRPGWNFDDRETAVKLYTEAIELDPKFALARARLSALLTIIFINKEPRPEVAKRAREEADEAVRLQPDLGEAHLARALCIYRIDRDYAGALRALEAVAPMLPNSSDTVLTEGYILRRQGRWRESLTRFDAALSRDPHNGQIAEEIRDTNHDVRNWPAGIVAADLALAFDPKSPSLRLERANFQLYAKGDIRPARAVLAAITPQQDAEGFFTVDRWSTAMIARDFAAAAHAIDERADQPIMNSQFAVPPDYFRGVIAMVRGETVHARELLASSVPVYETEVKNVPLDPQRHAMLGQLYSYLGRKDEALREGRRAVELCPESLDAFLGAVVATDLAEILARLGETDEALQLIKRLLTTPGVLNFQEMRLSWVFDPLRADPRFQKILSQPEPKTIY